jgi:putative endonuclease
VLSILKSTQTSPNAQGLTQQTSKQVGDAAEDQVLLYLQQAGLRLVQRNYRTPGRGGGEIDLIMREADGTLAFVEVRLRASTRHGGAAASVSAVKQRRIIFAARYFLMRLSSLPPCRFDVATVEGGSVTWIRGAFDAS